MQSITRKYAQNLYMPWLCQIVDHGDVVDVRGRNTKEILDGISVVEEPWHHCILIPSRRWNPWLAMSEALWILAGRNDVAPLEPFNSHIGDYSDDGVTLYGAYGARIYDQIDEVISRLKLDPSDRRAVLAIWDARSTLPDRPPIDLVANTKDPPCNNMVYFKLRDSKLHMTVICRSNDLHFGLFAVNLPTFGILQEYIAARLDVDLGNQTHVSNSLHIYTDDERAKAITRRMMYDEPDNVIKYPAHERLFYSKEFRDISSHKEFANICSSVLNMDNPVRSAGSRYPLFLAYAGIFLREYKKKEFHEISTFPEFADWNIAGRIFAERVWGQAKS